MLAIRMQRTGRSGHAQFRIVVQDTRQTPTSGRVVASLGNYNPHSKEVKVDLKKAELFIKNGAQPSDRVVTILKKEGLKMPAWVVAASDKKKKTTKNSDKLRKNRPAEPAKKDEPVAEAVAEEPTEDTAPAEVEAEVTTEETVAEATEEVVEEPVAKEAKEEKES